MFRTGHPLSCGLQKVSAVGLALLVVAGVARPGRAQSAHFYAQNTVATGLNNPQGLAVDSGGNVYIADDGNHRIVKETLSAGTYTQSVVLSGLIYADGTAVDASGNVYIADAGQQGILEERLSAGTYSANPTVIGSGFDPTAVAATSSAGSLYAIGGNGILYEEQLASAGSYTQAPIGGFALPGGVAVDASNQSIYVVDRQNGEVLMGTVVAGTYSGSAIVTGLSSPMGVAVDSSGNVYVVDQGANAVYKETPPQGTGSYTQSVVASELSSPVGVAVGANGAIYVSDASGGGRVLQFVPGAVSLGAQSIGSTSHTQTLSFTFDSAGTLEGYAVLTQGAAGLDFVDAGGGSCTPGTAYLQAASCTINVTFTPRFAGTRNGAVTLYNTAGTPIATAYLSGTGSGPQMAFFPSNESFVGSGTNSPLGVAVDGSGNVYVADTSNGRVLKGQTPAVTGLARPYGVAVDGAGNLYVAETYYHPSSSSTYGRVLKETLLSTGGYTASVIADGTTSPYPMSYPNAIAVDGSGNVYIANTNASQVLMEALLPTGQYAQSLVADAATDGLNSPKGVAVDGSGNVYVANTSGYDVLKETLSAAGTYAQSVIATLPSGGYDSPFGVAVDGSGSVYYTDQADNQVLAYAPTSSGSYAQTRVWTVSAPYAIAVDSSGNVLATDAVDNSVSRLDVVDPPSLYFASTRVGDTSSDSPQTVTVTNIGDADLAFPPPGEAGSFNPGIDPNFTYAPGSTCAQIGASAATFLLAAGQSCTETLRFTPQMAGTISGFVVNTDNNLNVASATQSIALNGTATAGMLNISVASLSVPYGTANRTLTATISYGGATPAGAVTFTINGDPNSQQVAACSTASRTETCTTTYNFSYFSPGTYSIYVSEAADQNYSAASGTASLAITQAAPSVTIAQQSIVYGTAQAVLSANITYTGVTAPQGAVTIALDNGPAMAATCAGVSSLGCTVDVQTSALPAGNHTVTAVEAADIDYTAATATGILVVNKATPVITWPQPAAFAVGTTLSSVQLDATANIAGTFAYAPAAGTILSAGAHILSVTFTPYDTANYITAVQQVTLAVLPYAATPIFVPGTGAYTSAQSLTLTDATPNATIFYTTDGSTPTTGSTPYMAPIPVPSTETVQAIATATGYETSAIATAVVTIYQAPVCTLGLQGTSMAGSVIALVSCTDPQGQALTSTLVWGDGTTTVAAQGRNAHTYANAGTYTVLLAATDTSGLVGKVQQQITPNQTPVCTLGIVQGAAANYAVTVSAACSDPQGQQLTLSIEWGDGTLSSAASNHATNAHTYANPNPNSAPYVVTLTAVDTLGLTGSNSQPVTILPALAPVAPGGASSIAIAAPTSSTAPASTQVTFICASVSTMLSGQVAVTNALPSRYGITCSAPTIALSSASAPVTVTIQTTSAGTTTIASANTARPTALQYAMVLPLPALTSIVLGMLLPGIARRRRNQFVSLCVILLTSLTLTACGGSFVPPPVVATPAGKYYITIVEVPVTTPAPSGFVQTSLIVPLPIGISGN